jgi:peptidoglycan/xylan/chitin deacetylase (PgdA/CDA1 family)
MRPIILAYHSIVEADPDRFATTVDTFAAQLSWLRSHQYEVVSLETLVDTLREGGPRAARHKAAITFDDGYEDFHQNALPVLQRMSVPATVFIVPGPLRSSSWAVNSRPAPLMTVDQIRAIKASGIDLGSHTSTHANLPNLSDDQMRGELTTSLQAIRELGQTFSALAYPWGQRGPRELKALEEIGYDCGLAADRPERLNIDGHGRFELGRLSIDRDMSLDEFAKAVIGPSSVTRFARTIRKAARRIAHR